MHETTENPRWLQARRALMAREKELTRLRDEVTALRRALPRRRIETPYVFEGPAGPCTLTDLFGDRTQLLVYHLMFDPTWDAACTSCSFWADHFDPMLPHLRARDIAFAAISSAPLAKVTAYAERMGWHFPWVSAAGSSFNRDFVVTFTRGEVDGREPIYNFATQRAQQTEMPGVSAFLREGDAVLHTYSAYSRGIDALNGTYNWLDLAPKGRDESDGPMKWLRRHDEYDR